MRSPPMTLNDYLRERLFEMFCVTAIIGMALTLAVSPRSIEVSTFRLMLASGLTQPLVMVMLLAIGTGRAAALAVNGRSRLVGPWVRAIGAGAGAAWWSQCGIALYGFTTASTATISMGVPMYASAAICELIVVYLAVQDASRRSDR